MFHLTAATRITLGLVCSMLGILMGANFIGLIPDYEKITLNHRAQTLVSLALSSAPMIEAGESDRLQAVLDAHVTRKDTDLVSIGIRKADGNVLAVAGPHAEEWPKDLNGDSTERFMQIPLSAQGMDQWGSIEVVYRPLRSDGILGQLQTRMTLLLIACAPVAFFSFRWFLTLVLKNLDPSQAIPKRVREALDILSEGLMIVGLNGRVLLANKATEVMTGYGNNKMVGVKASELPFQLVGSNGEYVDDEDKLPWLISLSESTSIANVMMQLPRANQSPRIFRVNCSPLVGNDGKLRGVMVTFDDVTALEKNKLALQAAKDEADAANKAKSDFLANMSHEIRNPMNAIVGFTDILRRGMEESEDTRRDYLNTIHASGTHLVGLINDILDLSKIESGKMELEICECSPYNLMSEVVNVLQMKAQDQNLIIDHSIEGTIPSVIQSDPTRLRQILMNLVGNAIKFTQKGSVRIVAKAVETHGRSQIQFDVIDTGIGMTEEQCSKIFEEFMQADTSVTRRFGGTGLGLAISKRLTEALGGEIHVCSVPNEGTTFTITIDTGDIVDVELVDDRQAAVSLAGQHKEKAHLTVRFKPARVLVTDDTPANRQLVSLVLRNSGLTVEEAENGLQAVQKAPAGNFDLLLMDMQMPVMDGFTATRKLRDQGLTEPIFALTANVMQSDRDMCAEAGCTGFLTKPIDIDKLLEALSEVLPLDESTPPSPQSDLTSETASSHNSNPVATTDDPTASAQPVDSQSDNNIHNDNQNAEQSLEDVMAMVDQALAPTLPPTTDEPKLYSTLPLEIPEFHEIVLEFALGLPQMMTEMYEAYERQDFAALRALAHKLKGTGGTVGFADFTVPAQQLQEFATQEDSTEIERSLAELNVLSRRVDVPKTCPA